MRVCYFIQAHNYPEQVYRLVRTIKKSSPNALIVIGYDFTNSSIDMELFQDLSDVYLLKNNFIIKRGHFEMLQPYLNAINWLFDKGLEFDWLAYISGQDYPIQPVNKIEKILFESKYDGFIDYWDIVSRDSYWTREDGKKRYFYQYYIFPTWTMKFFRGLQRLFPLKLNICLRNDLRVGIPLFKTPFKDNFICYGGNHRHFLSRKCVLFLREFIIFNNSLIQYSKKTLIPSESLVQTILVNSHKFDLYNHNKIYENWLYPNYEANDGHPEILTVQDYSKIIESKCFFARKFEPDSEILDMLDSHILSQNSSLNLQAYEYSQYLSCNNSLYSR